MQINKAWIEYNNTYNERGEGYNPHPKFIASPVARPAGRKMIMGKLRTEAEARKFASSCLSGAARQSFLAQVDAAFAA